jgi:anti-sigma factor RsiW
MKRPSEEILNAYADGAVDEQLRAEVEAYIHTDAAARDLVDRLRGASALVRQAFDTPIHEPPPANLVSAILGAQPGRAERLVALSRGAGAYAARMRRFSLPLAAALALAIGVGAGLLFSRGPGSGLDALALGAVPRDTGLHKLLDATPSGKVVEIAGPRGTVRRHMVVATLRDRHSRACREVEVLAPGADHNPLIAGIACRRPDGGWVVEGAVQLAAPAAGGQHIEPSGLSERDALEGLLALLGAQRALNSEEEQVLMARHWK